MRDVSALVSDVSALARVLSSVLTRVVRLVSADARVDSSTLSRVVRDVAAEALDDSSALTLVVSEPVVLASVHSAVDTRVVRLVSALPLVEISVETRVSNEVIALAALIELSPTDSRLSREAVCEASVMTCVSAVPWPGIVTAIVGSSQTSSMLGVVQDRLMWALTCVFTSAMATLLDARSVADGAV